MKRKICIILSILVMVILAAIITAACVWQPMIPPRDGEDGKSAFEIRLYAGNEGDMDDFLEWLRGNAGQDGASAFEIWLSQGHQGDYNDFLEWLRRPIEQPQTRTLNFSNTYFAPITAPQGTLIWQPSTPTTSMTALLAEQAFLGWYMDRNFTNKAIFPFMLNDDTTLYARWYIFRTEDFLIIDTMIMLMNFSLTTIVIPAFVTDVVSNGFSFARLENIIFEEGSRLESIGNAAFMGTGRLQYINLPNTLRYIGNVAFAMTSLASITIPYSVVYIEWTAFLGWTEEQTIYIQREAACPAWLCENWGWLNNTDARIVWNA